MNPYLTLGTAALLGLLIALVAAALLLRRRQALRGNSLSALLDLADRLETDLKTCRSGLQQAHAVMSLNPDLPAASEQDARHAIDAGLRALLQQRLWIRDRSPQASQRELDEAAASMRAARNRLQPLLQALNQAQTDLNSAMREHIRRESDSMMSNHPTPRIVLGSTSRYRAELLRRLLADFEQVAPGTDEAARPGEAPMDRALRLAIAKAEAAAHGFHGELVIGSDQVAELDGLILDKPGSAERAHAQLAASSGREVHFHTALCLLDTRDGRQHTPRRPHPRALSHTGHGGNRPLRRTRTAAGLRRQFQMRRTGHQPVRVDRQP